MATSQGTCSACGYKTSAAGMARHLTKCMAEQGAGGSDETIRLRVSAPGRPGYWLDVEVRSDARLADLDGFLRGIWLECCGHLSEFTIDGKSYAADEDGIGAGASSMNTRIDRALRGVSGQFRYEYDFGSTTLLRLSVIGRHTGRSQQDAVRLLARNDAPVHTCWKCDADAVWVCNGCSYDGMKFACARHASKHRPCVDDAWVPVSNSPRMGVCAYAGRWPEGE